MTKNELISLISKLMKNQEQAVSLVSGQYTLDSLIEIMGDRREIFEGITAWYDAVELKCREHGFELAEIKGETQ